MHKLITSAKDTEDWSIGSDRDRGRRQQELSKNKTQKSKFHLKHTLKHLFGFADNQQKATLGPGYKLTLTRNTDNVVLNKDNTNNNAKIKINNIEWFIPHYTHSFSNQAILSPQMLSKTPTELQYV